MAYGRGAAAVRAIDEVTPRHRARRVHRRGRPLGLRQELADEADLRAAPAARRQRSPSKASRSPARSSRSAWRSRTPTCCPGATRSRTCCCRWRSSSRTAADFSKQKYAGKAQDAAGVRRAAGVHRKASLGALGRHAAAHLDLPRADPRARDPAARRAVRRARRVHARGAVVRAARPAGGAQGDGDAGDARPARGGVPRRHRVRDVEPAGAHRAALRGARCRGRATWR